MSEIAIVGAGELGGAVAHLLARADLVNIVRLVDEFENVAAGKALDIMQAAPIEQFSTRVAGTTDLFSVGGATAVVFADRAGASGHSVEWRGEAGVQQLGRVCQIARNRTIVCAGGAQLDLVEGGVAALKLARHQILGSAPEALAAALRACVAVEANASPADVSLAVLGRPPGFVVPWDQAVIGGRSLTKVLDEPALRRLASRIALLWPPGPHSLAAAAVKAIGCLMEDSRQLVSCFTASGRRDEMDRAVAAPARLGASGVMEIEVAWLSAHDQVALDNQRS